MKKVLPLFLACLILLSGCKTAGGFLVTPDSPSADLPDRPGAVSTDESETASKEESEQENTELPERNMTFSKTDTPHLFSVLTRQGDRKILGMTYGDGTYFALTQREKGIALTGYDTDGIGTFAGILEESFTFPTLMGFADGYACLYSAETGRTFACKADSTHVWFDRDETDSVRLYRGGYVLIRDGAVSFFGPQNQKAYASYTVPDDMTFLLGDEEHALASAKDGSLVQLTFSPDGMTKTALPPYLSYDGNVLAISDAGQTVIFNPYDLTLVAAPKAGKVLAAGKGYLIGEQNGSLWFLDTKNGKTFSMPKDGAFHFGGRTEDGFLFAQDGAWYLLKDEALVGETDVLQYQTDTELLTAAYKALCNAAPKQLRLFDRDFPTGGDLSATEVTDGEVLFASAAFALSAFDRVALADSVHIYLCDSVTVGASPVPYAMQEENGVTSILLDVTDPHCKTQLTEILTMLQEGIQG